MPLLPLLPLLALLAACAGPHQAARQQSGIADLEPGDRLDADAHRLSAEAFARRAGEVRFVLVGESHDNPCDHRAEAAVLADLASLAPLVGLEMVDVDHQDVLDRFDRGAIAVAALGEALDWKRQWGFDYALYQPIFVVAADRHLGTVGLNLPSTVVRQVMEKGADQVQDPRMPAIIPPLQVQRDALHRSFAQHAQMGVVEPGDEEHFVQAQSLWDTQMAARALAQADSAGKPMVILAGDGHVRSGWGIAYRLHVLRPGDRVLSVLPWRGSAALPRGEGDVFYYCPD